MRKIISVLVFLSAVQMIAAGCGSAPVESAPGNGPTGPPARWAVPGDTEGPGGKGPRAEPAAAKIIFVRQRCVVVETSEHVLVFDPPEFKTRGLGRKTFLNGFVDTGEYRNSDVTVFITSRAYDRFYPDIWNWKKSIKKLSFVITQGVSERDPRFKGDGISIIKPGGAAEISGVKVTAIPASGESVAYFIEADGLRIYYSGEFGLPGGDLTTSIGEKAEVDIAIHAFNRRGGKAGCSGALKLAKDYSPGLMIPLEPGGRISTISQLADTLEKTAPAVHVWKYKKMGDSLDYPADLEPQEESE